MRSDSTEELADVQELALVIVEVYFVDPKIYTHENLRNSEFRQRRDCSVRFVATLICLVALFRYRRFREERNSSVGHPVVEF